MLRKEWFTTTEVAALVGFSDRWVRRQIELGRLHAYAFDPGGRRALRVRRVDFEDFRSEFFMPADEAPRRWGA